MRISDWSSDVCSSDLGFTARHRSACSSAATVAAAHRSSAAWWPWRRPWRIWQAHMDGKEGDDMRTRADIMAWRRETRRRLIEMRMALPAAEREQRAAAALAALADSAGLASDPETGPAPSGCRGVWA